MRFRDEHRFPAPVQAVADVLVDPAFHRRLELPDLQLLDVVDHRDDGRDAVLSLRYEYVGHLDPVAQRLLGGSRLTWIQELVVHRATGGGQLTFAVEGNQQRLHGTAEFTLHAEQDETVWELRGEVRVGIPLVGGSAERRILAGVLRRLDIQAQQMTNQLRGGT